MRRHVNSFAVKHKAMLSILGSALLVAVVYGLVFPGDSWGMAPLWDEVKGLWKFFTTV